MPGQALSNNHPKLDQNIVQAMELMSLSMD